MRIRINALNASPMGGSIIVNMIIPKAFSNAVETIIRSFKAGCEYDLKQFKQKRSLSANALCWVYCDELAKKLKTTKEDVYKNAISYVGVENPNGTVSWGSGVNSDIIQASIVALVNAINNGLTAE